MIGVVLAAGPGRRLGALTETLPKTLLPVDDERSILDVTLANFKHVGLDEAVVVVGFAADRIRERVPALERRHGVHLELVFNPRAEEWNNAYSLWCAREAMAQGALLANGDTLHPVSVEEVLLAHRSADIVLALDDRKRLGEEEMKVELSATGTVEHIHKGIDPGAADGEYIGVALVEPPAVAGLAEALEATWRRDSSLYYEDAFGELARRGGEIRAVSVGEVDWVEVDDDRDFARAREVACRY